MESAKKTIRKPPRLVPLCSNRKTLDPEAAKADNPNARISTSACTWKIGKGQPQGLTAEAVGWQQLAIAAVQLQKWWRNLGRAKALGDREDLLKEELSSGI